MLYLERLDKLENSVATPTTQKEKKCEVASLEEKWLKCEARLVEMEQYSRKTSVAILHNKHDSMTSL